MKLRVKLMVCFVLVSNLSRSIAARLTPPATKLGKGGAADHFFRAARQHGPLAKAGAHGKSGSRPSPGKRGGDFELHQLNESMH